MNGIEIAIVCLSVGIVVGVIILSIVRKKQGKSGCGSCGDCPYSGSCSSKKKKK